MASTTLGRDPERARCSRALRVEAAARCPACGPGAPGERCRPWPTTSSPAAWPRAPRGRSRGRARAERPRSGAGVIEARYTVAAAGPRCASSPPCGTLRPHRVPVDDHIQLAALVRPEVVPDRRAGHRHRARVSAPVAGVIVAPREGELPFVQPFDPERTAHDLLLGQRPVFAVALDRVARLRPTVRPVQDAEEVRSRRSQPELDRQLVQCTHSDAVQVVVPLQVIVLGSLEHEVDRHRGARRFRVEESLDPVLDVVRGQRLPSDQVEPSRRWKT